MIDFACKTCSWSRLVQSADVVDNNVSNDQVIGEVSEFCCLGDFLSCNDGPKHVVKARVESAWRKWIEL